MSVWHALALAVAAALFVFDFQNVLAWWKGRTLGPSHLSSDDYTIVVPVYGHPRYFDGREHLRGEIERVLVAVETGAPGMDAFADELKAEGWRVAKLRVAAPSPPTLIQAALPLVGTEVVIRMDADTRPLAGFGRYVATFLADGADIASTRVLVANPRTEVGRFQELEYRMAMLSRAYRPWLTSGACLVARRRSLWKILETHSMWFPGEDIETGRIAHALRMRIRYLTIPVETEAPETWRGLFRQRRLWWAGSFRHTVVNADRNALQLPIWTFYYLGAVWIGVYFKWHTLIGYLHPFVLLQTLGVLFAIYAVITVVANWQERSWRMLIFPPYALAQAVLMPTVGSVYYLLLARRQGYLGRYRFGYRRREVLAAAEAAC